MAQKLELQRTTYEILSDIGYFPTGQNPYK